MTLSSLLTITPAIIGDMFSFPWYVWMHRVYTESITGWCNSQQRFRFDLTFALIGIHFASPIPSSHQRRADEILYVSNYVFLCEKFQTNRFEKFLNWKLKSIKRKFTIAESSEFIALKWSKRSLIPCSEQTLVFYPFTLGVEWMERWIEKRSHNKLHNGKDKNFMFNI